MIIKIEYKKHIIINTELHGFLRYFRISKLSIQIFIFYRLLVLLLHVTKLLGNLNLR